MQGVKNVGKTIAAGAAFLALSSFFSPDSALAKRKEKPCRSTRKCCLSKKVPAKGEYKPFEEKKGRKRLRYLRVFGKTSDEKVRIMVQIPGRFVRSLESLKEDAQWTAYKANADYAIVSFKESPNKKAMWHCLMRAPPEPEKSPKTSSGRKLSTSAIEDALSGTKEHTPEGIKKPEPAPEIKKRGNWYSITKFSKNPPLNGGKKYSMGGSGISSMVNANKRWIRNIFERVVKRDNSIGGKVEVKLKVRNGVVQKVSFKGGNTSPDLLQKYANLFGRSRWTGTRTILFPLILQEKN
jgi:hypothetical protein